MGNCYIQEVRQHKAPQAATLIARAAQMQQQAGIRNGPAMQQPGEYSMEWRIQRMGHYQRLAWPHRLHASTPG